MFPQPAAVALLPHTAPRYELTVRATQAENVAGGREWRKLHNAELPSWYYTANIIWMTQPGKVRWAENVARTGEKGNA